MYDALKSKLIGQESHIKQLEEEAQVVLEKLKDQEDQMQTMQTMFDEKLKEEKSERDRLLRDSFEREKRYNNQIKEKEAEMQAVADGETAKLRECQDELR